MNIIRELAIAPTGKRFAAVLARGQIGGGVNSESSSELWILPSPGEAGPPKQLLLNFTSGSSGLHVSWMPDSRRLLATVAKKGEAADLYLIDIETSGVTRLTRGLHDHRNPVVAPDGSKFAVEVDSSDRDTLHGVGSGITQTLLATARQEWSPQWFRNGAQYAYLTNANGNREIWVRNVMEGTACHVDGPGCLWPGRNRNCLCPLAGLREACSGCVGQRTFCCRMADRSGCARTAGCDKP